MRVALQADAPTTREPDLTPPATLVAHARWHAGGNRDGAFDFLLASGLTAIPWRRFAERSIAEPADPATDDRQRPLPVQAAPAIIGATRRERSS